ncbi:MAG: VCBS repeat-containing protein [Verrucomicrobiaceae bacterium]|nr:VCBS repeat-containing protein [Verrucomicrobiaceae bacterium]
MENAWFCLRVLQSMVVLCLLTWLSPGCNPREEHPPSGTSSPDVPVMEIIPAPGLENAPVIGPLADAWSRIDPKKDGWDSEALSAAVGVKLKKLAGLMENPSVIGNADIEELVDGDFKAGSLRALRLETIHEDSAFTVHRGITEDSPSDGMIEKVRHLLAVFDRPEPLHAAFKIYRIDASEGLANARVLFQLSGMTRRGGLQINSEWDTLWKAQSEEPKLLGIKVSNYTEVRYLSDGSGDGSETLFVDATASILGNTEAYKRQLLRSTDYWRSRVARDFGLDVVANHGLAIGDVNGDGLEDIYLCQQGGLPNRLFVRNTDGTLRDMTETSSAGWLDYCASALILDFDNDGDCDLAVSQDFKILFMDNLGEARFELALGLSTHAQTFSISAADFDLDGDLDLFLCGYNPAADRSESGALGEPLPYHDAQNGGRNMLLRNDGDWEFVEVTAAVGLDQNNNRFSFAASWEDYDNDGDPDLYVSNDYGRNNLYRNDGGMFIDVAAKLGVEDMSAGMSANWADFNRDGALDLYISNMFSSAGNRITYQRQFKPGAGDKLIAGYRRHARGNSLFEGRLDGGQFRDASVSAGVTMGRWAWGSRFADINNDGWQDLVVANGFISAPDTGDL